MKNKGLLGSNGPGFIDIHSHILPGVDDGAENIAESMKLLRMAHKDGTRAIILTPHYRSDYKKYMPEQLKERYELLCESVEKELPDMQLYLGNEIHFEMEAPEAVESGRVLTLNGSNYVLLEFRPNCLRRRMVAGVSEMIRHGFTPIIAHVERYTISRKDPSLLQELWDMGALMQLNVNSVMGQNGFGIKRFCHKLLKAERVHFIASDTHDVKYRTPLLQKCYLKVCKKYGQSYADELFYENAQAVIENNE